MGRPLWLKLVLPLALLSGLALGVHYRFDIDRDGLFLNVGSELVGIIVTVAYVDWVIRRHESDRWRGTKSRISRRIEVFINSLVSGVRSSLGFGPDVMDYSIVSDGDPKLIQLEVLRVAEHILIPVIPRRVATLDLQGWKRLAAHLRSVYAEAEHILNGYSTRLEPRQIELLLDIEWEVQSALIYWSVFPDLAGVFGDKIPETSTPPEILQRHGCDSTAGALLRLLDYAKELANA